MCPNTLPKYADAHYRLDYDRQHPGIGKRYGVDEDYDAALEPLSLASHFSYGDIM
jgi:hypothetical protein